MTGEILIKFLKQFGNKFKDVIEKIKRIIAKDD